MSLPEKTPTKRLSATEKRLKDDIEAANEIISAMKMLIDAEKKAHGRGLTVSMRLGEHHMAGVNAVVSVRRGFANKSIEISTTTIERGRP
jgi:hypothetical protein